MAKKKVEQLNNIFPLFAEASKESTASSVVTNSSSRRTSSRLVLEPFSDRYPNIKELQLPYAVNADSINIREVIILAQKAYFGFSIVRQTINMMGELAAGKIHLRGGNKKALNFVNAWLQKVGMDLFAMQWFNDHFRCANNFTYRYDSPLKEGDLVKMNQIFGTESYAAKVKKVPVRYILLNPADIIIQNTVNFIEPVYCKVLSGYELERLRHPKTEADKEVFDSLSPEDKKSIKLNATPFIKLDPYRLSAVFYKKKDYEPFGVPLVYSVLEDLNLKAELKKIDKQLNNIMDYAVLAITMGAKPDEGGVNQEHLKKMQALFTNRALQRVLIADYTTKLEWAIPDLSHILGAEKYKQVDEDIRNGLNAFFFDADEKFATASVKISLFLQGIQEAQKLFIDSFLQPEVKRICKELGFDNYPEVYFEEIDLKDELQYAKLYTQLLQLGALTPAETFEAINEGVFPTAEESLEHQKEFKSQKDKGYYNPLVGGQEEGDGAGRPSGAKAPQTTKKVSPIGTSKAYKISEIVDATKKLTEFTVQVQNAAKAHWKVKSLDEAQLKNVKTLINLIVCNEKPIKWQESIANYMKEPKPIKEKIQAKIAALSDEFELDTEEATLLYLSQKI